MSRPFDDPHFPCPLPPREPPLADLERDYGTAPELAGAGHTPAPATGSPDAASTHGTASGDQPAALSARNESAAAGPAESLPPWDEAEGGAPSARRAPGERPNHRSPGAPSPLPPLPPSDGGNGEPPVPPAAALTPSAAPGGSTRSLRGEEAREAWRHAQAVLRAGQRRQRGGQQAGYQPGGNRREPPRGAA